MIKAKLYRCYDRIGYYLYIYQEGDNGKIYPAKPIKLEFDNTKDYSSMCLQPTLMLPDLLEIDPSTQSESNKLLIQKEDDKERHIKSLEMIIDKLVNK